MPIDPKADLEITAFEWVPPFARGLVRDLRVRWACEEAGLAYRERLIAVANRPEWYFAEQPWGQVPTLVDGKIRLFESGAILVHLGEKRKVLLPAKGQERADALSWLFAALNSVEPLVLEYVRVILFNAKEQWAQLRRPGLEQAIVARLQPVARRLSTQDWLAGPFSIADIAMVTVLRVLRNTDLATRDPTLAAYLARGEARGAFEQALADQLAPFDANAPEPQPEEA